MRILGAALAPCVHVAGVMNFLALAREAGIETDFLGPATTVRELVGAAIETRPDYLAVSYRLSPAPAEALFAQLGRALKEAGITIPVLFGGPPPAALAARKSGVFSHIFDGNEARGAVQEVISALIGGPRAGASSASTEEPCPGDLAGRLRVAGGRPLLRHHFGLPSMEATLDGLRKIAEAGVVDVISIAPDQNAQEHLFAPRRMSRELDGAGGVPIRGKRDLDQIYQATRRGNYPLVRCYAGTRDLLRWAELLRVTIRNAWAAIPLYWYSELDGRSNRPLGAAIRENQEAIRWHGERGIPVEVNEAHHWSLRQAPDAVDAAAFYLAAHNAKKLGCNTYVAQFMLNTPPGTSPLNDLVKAAAKIEMLETLSSGDFRVLRAVRAGLANFRPDPGVAKGQLAASVYLGLALDPDIVHVVGFSEADHAATAEEVIESCRIAQGVLYNCAGERPGSLLDPEVQRRKDELTREAWYLIGTIKNLTGDHCSDPLTDPAALERAVRLGILDAPHLAGEGVTPGRSRTAMIGGACRSVDPITSVPLSESARLAAQLLQTGS